MSTSHRGRVRAARGPELRCRGWKQEGLLRLLENTLENAERPEELIVYGGTGQAARDWQCFDTIVASLMDLHNDETLVIQSGKPVARFKSFMGAPRVLTANTNLVGQWAQWERFYDLRARGLLMYGQYTAGAWQFIGQQGVLQSTYETLAACSRLHFDGTLEGRLVVSAGLGAMGGAQPLAITLLGGVALIIEVDEERARRRLDSGYLDQLEGNLDSALEQVSGAVKGRVSRSVCLIGNAADVLPELLKRGVRPDVVTDQTSAHDALHGYVPRGLTTGEALALRMSSPAEYEREALESIRLHVTAMLEFQRHGSIVFEYGNAIRQQAVRAGLDNAFDFGGFVQLFVRPSFCVGRGPCRWIALSGDPSDIRAIDEAMLLHFADDLSVVGWINMAMERVPHQGLPARTAWLNYLQRRVFGALVNQMIGNGDLAGPVAITRDHLDSGAVAQPTRETEGMRDGSDGIADWPILNALLNASGGADLVAVHQGGGSGMGGSISAGMTLILDGSDEAHGRLERVLRMDPGIGVIRHADAGYEEAIQMVNSTDLVAPMLDAPSPAESALSAED